MKLIIELSDEALELLNRPVRGSGGWQSLLIRIKEKIVGNELILNVNDAAKIFKYTIEYGQGGFEDRLRPIVHEILSFTNALLNSLGYESVDI